MRHHVLILIAPLLLLLAGCQTDLALVDLKSRWAGPSSRFLPMDGIEVHWRDEGPAQLAPLVPSLPRPRSLRRRSCKDHGDGGKERASPGEGMDGSWHERAPGERCFVSIPRLPSQSRSTLGP